MMQQTFCTASPLLRQRKTERNVETLPGRLNSSLLDSQVLQKIHVHFPAIAVPRARPVD
jgi:hypothetical protein